MSTAELIPLIETLPGIEKFRLLQFLVADLGKEAGFLSLNAAAVYPIWTPYDVPTETVNKLATMLAEEKVEYGV